MASAREATCFVLDNSEFSRNGDLHPSRFASQRACVEQLGRDKLLGHQDATVGVLQMAGGAVDVLLSPTTQIPTFSATLARVAIEGETADLVRGLTTAQMVLKHRREKSCKQRVVAFVCSPLRHTQKELEQVGKLLKKNNVAVDVIAVAQLDENREKLAALVNALNSRDSTNSRLVEVAADGRDLNDVVRSAFGGGSAGMGGGGGMDDLDLENDPELAMALRISMEDERQRQAATQGGEGGEAAAAPTPAAVPAAVPLEMEGLDDMDPELRQALELSMAEVPAEGTAAPAAGAGASAASSSSAGTAVTSDAGAGGAAANEEEDQRKLMSELLEGLEGVDAADPELQEALRDLGGRDQKKDGDKK